MKTTIEKLPGDTEGVSYELTVFRFKGTSKKAPTGYIQAALHAGELPGVVALHALMPKLRAGASRGPHPRRHHHRAISQSGGTRAISFRRRAGPLPFGHPHQLQPRLPAARQARRERPAPGDPRRDRRPAAQAPAGRTLHRPRHRARPPLRRRGCGLSLCTGPALAGDAGLRGRNGRRGRHPVGRRVGRSLRGGRDPPLAADSARKGQARPPRRHHGRISRLARRRRAPTPRPMPRASTGCSPRAASSPTRRLQSRGNSPASQRPSAMSR